MFVHVIKSLFCEAEAGEIISLAGESGQAQASLVGGAMHHNIRRARISWLDDQGSAKWVMDRIVDAVAEANRDTFRFRLDGFDEKLQVASYDEHEQGHFDWHSDTGGGPLAARRKLTIVAQLSRPGSHDGGELQLNPRSAVLSQPQHWRRHRVRQLCAAPGHARHPGRTPLPHLLGARAGLYLIRPIAGCLPIRRLPSGHRKQARPLPRRT
jgi:PKHD-type hydroxylase